MEDETAARRELSERIERRRFSISSFLQRARPRRSRLTTVSVVGSALAAALTAIPAFGGTGFTASVQGTFSLADSSTVWRLLCLAAMVFSLAAALATNLANSHSLATQVTAAEACNAELDGLQTALAYGHLPIDDAVQLYQQYVAKVAFVDEASSR